MTDKLYEAKGVFYEGILRDTRKSNEKLRPLYEAFTNSLEAIKAYRSLGEACGKIQLEIHFRNGTTDEDYIFDRLVIKDDGIGFDDENFHRLTMYKDDRKGFSNKGSGRLQLVHFFGVSQYISTYRSEGELRCRKFTLSAKYASQNALIAEQHCTSADLGNQAGTTLILHSLLSTEDDSYYSKLTANQIKSELLTKYMLEFCAHRETLPEIKISRIVRDEEDEICFITAEEIPSKYAEGPFELTYSRMSADGRSVEKTIETATLNLTSFAIPWNELESNEIKLTSKNEIATGTKINLECLTPKDKIDGKRYLFLLSGNYLDSKDGDTRGNLKIPTKEEFRRTYADDLFEEKEIVLEDLAKSTNQAILEMHEEIRRRSEEMNHDLEELEEMFLLDPETIKSLSIKIGESEESILRKVYSEDAKTIARNDAELKSQIDRLNELDPSAENYGEELRKVSDDVTRSIPLQMRKELTHYVARRRLVLELFQKILDQELLVQKQAKRNMDEKLLHNLIFKQSSDNPDQSDLWLISEEYIYFNGHSEHRLIDIEINGEKMFKEDFAEIEIEYLKSGGEDRMVKRPDILLFPSEGKCIIIEFKSPSVNVSNHLDQISKYSYWIQNYSKEKFQICTFYGYLIGETLSAGDVQAADGHFENAYHLDYLFCPHTPIRTPDGQTKGSLYMEAIKYSTLLKRAKIRNQIFIDKLNPPKQSPIDDVKDKEE